MKRLLLFAAIVSAIFTSCESDPEGGKQGNNYGFEVTTDLEINMSNSSALGFINYTIESPTAEGVVTATADVDWIKSLNTEKYGKVSYSVDFNESTNARTGIISLAYEDAVINVTINQAGAKPDTVIEVPVLTGHYYGTISTPTYNYYLCFSNKGLDSNNLTNNPDTYYYIVDLFLNEAPVDDNFRVPDGTYYYDMSSGAPGTFAYYSWYQEVDSMGNVSFQREYMDGSTLTVEGNKLTLSAILASTDEFLTERHVVTYEGDYSLVDMRDAQ